MEGKQRDFLAAYDQFADNVYRHCVIRVSDHDEAIDIMQEAFTKTWNYMKAGNEIRNMKAFVFRITNNLIIDWYRKKKASPFEEGEEFTLPDEQHAHDPEVAVDATYARDLLAVLDEPYRTTIMLRFIEGMGPKEIAEVMGESENAVSVRVHRGIKQLQEYIREQENNE